jgi:hypothetical protein
VKTLQIQRLEQIMQDKMTENSLATASDLMNLKDNTPPEVKPLYATLTQRSVFDMSLGILAMNICGNLYSCFDYLSSEVSLDLDTQQTKPYLL